jgi:predicted dehydrogenase
MAKKLGIIGYGNMGSWHAKQVKERIAGLDVVGIYDIDPVRCKLAEENGLIVYPTAEALLTSGIDLVVVATPNNFH